MLFEVLSMQSSRWSPSVHVGEDSRDSTPASPQISSPLRGTLEITNFPSHAGVPPRTETFFLPTSHNRTGAVRCMEWSSDGYVLAVGWEAGWAVWSVGGRCLAWAIGVDHEIDESR